jgi:hypothetical protein
MSADGKLILRATEAREIANREYAMRVIVGSILAMALIICFSQNALALLAFQSGNDLYAKCTNKDDFSQGTCDGYITGIADELIAFDAAQGREQCIPTNASVRQVVDVVMNALREHPESRDHVAADVVTGAFASEWKCPK